MPRIAGRVALAAAFLLAAGATTASAAEPEIDVSPTSIDFGTHEVWSWNQAGIEVDNTGDAPLHLGGVTVTGPAARNFYAGQFCGAVIPADTICITSVYFGPDERGVHTATLSIPSDDSDEPVVQVGLTGTAIAPFLVGPSSIDFGTLGPDGGYRLAFEAVRNDGDEDANNLGLHIGGPDATSFSLAQDGCTGQSLASGGAGSCGFTVVFSPDSAGSKSATLTFCCDNYGETLLQIPLKGAMEQLPAPPGLPRSSPPRHHCKKGFTHKRGKCVKRNKKGRRR